MSAIPSAWRLNGPTSDNTTESTSVTPTASAVTAAATRVTDEKVKRAQATGQTPEDSWQREAWFMYDQVGELRYVSNAIASRMGQAELYVEKGGVRQDEIDPILALITPQMVTRMGLNLFVAGACNLAGLPVKPEDVDAEDGTVIRPEGDRPDSAWVVLSTLEVRRGQGTDVEIRGEKYAEDKIYLERIWDPHPAKWQNSDSPVRSALPVLRELVGLTQHVSAQIDSRLAGAGVYWIPNSILNAAKVPTTDGDEPTFNDNPVLNAIMQAMLMPMEDRSNAAAIVPLLLGAPDEAIDHIRFDTFATPFDENTKELREEAIRRLGLNLDAPPELLMGMGDANHWGMWLVRDEVVQAHVKPRLDLITDALTTGFYRPIFKQQNPDSKDEADQYIVRADVSQLVQRPNRLADASQLHAVGTLSDATLRTAGGFEETDAPTTNERAIAIAIQTAQANPQLIDNMPEIVASVQALLDGTPATGADQISSKREPGTLIPLVKNTSPQVHVETTPNGTKNQSDQPKPLQETDARPGAARPV